jgi:hypothetical protein
MSAASIAPVGATATIPDDDLEFLVTFIASQASVPRSLGEWIGGWLVVAMVTACASLVLPLVFAMMMAGNHPAWAAMPIPELYTPTKLLAYAIGFGLIPALILIFGVETSREHRHAYGLRIARLLAAPDLFRHQSPTRPSRMVLETLPSPGQPQKVVLGRPVWTDAKGAVGQRVEIPIPMAERVTEFLWTVASAPVDGQEDDDRLFRQELAAHRMVDADDPQVLRMAKRARRSVANRQVARDIIRRLLHGQSDV